jgi:hypothetical protein
MVLSPLPSRGPEGPTAKKKPPTVWEGLIAAACRSTDSWFLSFFDLAGSN